ncbi:MAG: exosome complex protein Rrp42 [Candidatus Woesearchaeota archaeon]|jgi:exosome complex component RRP42|nr:exosome complex protein Rrp42 [Candidatus Woesearchaeota archaeon]|tara:strand:- start:26 stop:802 length:777 start_codon:yes stop_codon:yes gene_type:complete
MSKALRTHILNSLDKGMRLDGRKADEIRDIKIEFDVTKNAEGSAKVTWGETEVIAGVKMGLESPYPDSPEDGNLMVNAELLPLSNPEFETGPPGIQAIEMARVIDRGIRESKSIDTKKLCLKAGEKVWSVMVDILPINDAGNLLDVGSVAAIAAIKNAKFPEVSKDFEVDYKTKSKTGIPMKQEPIEVTVYKIGEHLIVDPTIDEMKVYDARLTVAYIANGDIVAMQKAGEEAITIDVIGKMVELAHTTSEKIRAKLG